MKELRQAVRSRIYVYIFMTILFICFFIIALFLLAEKVQGGSMSGAERVGSTAFLILFTPFYIVALLGIPMTAFLSQLLEVEQDCLELVQVTGLTTGQIIRGKIYAAVVKLLLFLTAMIPFFAFSYLLRGISILSIVIPLIATVFLSTLLVTVYLFFSMLVRSGFSKVLSMLFVVGLSLLLGLSLSGFVSASIFRGYTAWGSIFGGTAMALAVWGGLVFLFHQASLAMAMKSTKNRTWPVRFAFLILMVVVLSIPFIRSWFSSANVSEMYGPVSYFLWPLLAILGLVWATEKDRIPRTVAESNEWYMYIPYLSRVTLPGGVWGYHFTILCCFYIVGLGAVAYWMDQPFSTGKVSRAKLLYQSQFIISGYMLMYVGCAHYLGKWLRSFWPQIKLRTIRGIVLVGIAAVMIIPILVLGYSVFMTQSGVLNAVTMFHPLFMFKHVQENKQWLPYFLIIVGIGMVLFFSTFVTGRNILRESSLQEI